MFGSRTAAMGQKGQASVMSSPVYNNFPAYITATFLPRHCGVLL